MLSPAFKGTALTIQAILNVALGQLKSLSIRSGHEKITAAVGHLEQCVAEIADCVGETR